MPLSADEHRQLLQDVDRRYLEQRRFNSAEKPSQSPKNDSSEMSQHDFNAKVYDLLEAIVEQMEPHGRRSEHKHEIVGDPLHDLLHAALLQLLRISDHQT